MGSLLQKWMGWMDQTRQALFQDVALLLMRVSFGLTMMLSHGWGKMMKLGASPIKFADPIGVGPAASLFLAVFAEVGCSLLLIVGLATRLSTIPLISTMTVAIFVIHGADPFRRKEMAVVYLVVYLVLLLAGPGRFSLDAILRKKVAGDPTTNA